MSELSHDSAVKSVPTLSKALPNPFSADAAIYYVLGVIWVFLALLAAGLGAPGFFALGNIANVLFQASFVALLAVPMTLLLISGNFDLSIGANAALCAACLLPPPSQRTWWAGRRHRTDIGLRHAAGAGQQADRPGTRHQRLHRDPGHDDDIAWLADDRDQRAHGGLAQRGRYDPA